MRMEQTITKVSSTTNTSCKIHHRIKNHTRGKVRNKKGAYFDILCGHGGQASCGHRRGPPHNADVEDAKRGVIALPGVRDKHTREKINKNKNKTERKNHVDIETEIKQNKKKKKRKKKVITWT